LIPNNDESVREKKINKYVNDHRLEQTHKMALKAA